MFHCRFRLLITVAMLMLVSWAEITDVAGQGVRRSLVNPNLGKPDVNNIKDSRETNTTRDGNSKEDTNTGTVKKDYFGLKLHGVPDEDIWYLAEKETKSRKAKGMGPIAVVLDKEQTWSKYKDQVFHGNRSLYESQWLIVSEQYKQFKSTPDSVFLEAFNAKQVEDPRPSFVTLQGQLPVGKTLDDFKFPSKVDPAPEGFVFDGYGNLRKKNDGTRLTPGIIISIVCAGLALVLIISVLFRRMVYTSNSKKK